eukprot:3696120-Pyramimonas_sp.AAC.1
MPPARGPPRVDPQHNREGSTPQSEAQPKQPLKAETDFKPLKVYTSEELGILEHGFPEPPAKRPGDDEL